MNRVSVVILAGGRSSRFGRDKLAEPVDGRPLLHHAIDAVRPVAAEIVVVAAPDAMPIVPDDVRIVHDLLAFEGPLAGARVGLAAASESMAILVGGDMPGLVAAVLESMVVVLLRSDDVDAVVLEQDGRLRPLPMAVRRDAALAAIDPLLAHGERRLRALTEALTTEVMSVASWRLLDPDGSTTRDIDSPADLS